MTRFPNISDCHFQLKWKITIDNELYIQNNPKKTWSQDETWQVPPRPGPSQGKRNPKRYLSAIRRDDWANKTPLSNIRVVTWMVKACIWWTSQCWINCAKIGCIEMEWSENKDSVPKVMISRWKIRRSNNPTVATLLMIVMDACVAAPTIQKPPIQIWWVNKDMTVE